MTEEKEEKLRFITLMAGLSDYYRQEMSKVVIGTYFHALKEFEFDDIQKAAYAHMRNPETAGSFMPKINEFVKMMEGSTTDQSALAWSKVDQAVRQVGPYQDVAFDDPIIHRVIGDMGSWILMCGKDDKEWPFIGNEFKTRYKGYRMRGEVPEHAPVLIGVSNAHNTQQLTGVRFLPVFIGDAAKCQQVMSDGTSQPLLQMRHASELKPNVQQITGE